MRVVAGEARGRRLQAPAGRATRPTSDRVRESIFDILTSLDAIEGAVVADLFAGSGALGIEALSRGAHSATFVEEDRQAGAVIQLNLRECRMDAPERSKLVSADVATWVAHAPFTDLVLADPPYGFADWPALLTALRPVTGLAVLETATGLDVGPTWRVLKEKRYGGTVVTVARPALPPDGPEDRKGGM